MEHRLSSSQAFEIIAQGTDQHVLVGLAAIVVAGICAQWVAWRLRLPAILFLLATGIAAGPGWQIAAGHKLLDPDQLFGHLLRPIISLSVAIILFEGGLTLNLADLRNSGQVLWRLVTVGALISWAVCAVAAAVILGMPWGLSILLGAVLVVTGPTVIGPMLRHVRPIGDVGAILKWEGIVIDPIGAVLALLVFEALEVHGAGGAGSSVAGVVTLAIVRTLGCGLLIGSASALLLLLMLRRFWVSDQLQVPVTLTMVLAAFVSANVLQDESGLLAVTVMGLFLANQRLVPVAHILEFKESLTVLLIGTLFVVLGARLDASQISKVGWRTFFFVIALLAIARPLAVWVCTVGSKLKRTERLFLAWMAPRGIVAASVSSVFALRLRREAEVTAADQLVPATFAVIVATVSVYGSTASWLAGRLGLSRPGNRGFLIAGANLLARQIGKALLDAGQEVLLVDTNRDNINAAKMDGLPTFQGNIVSEQLLRRIDGTGIGRLLALTPNTDVNSLAAVHFARHFGRSQVFQLPVLPRSDKVEARVKADVSHELRGRPLFDESLNYERLSSRLRDGHTIKRTQLTKEFDYAAMSQKHGRDAMIPLFVIDSSGELHVNSAAEKVAPKPGQTVIAMVPADASPAPQQASAAPAARI